MRNIFCRLVCLLVIVGILVPLTTLGAQLPLSFLTNFDTIPNFAHSPTITSVQNGSWSQASTWSPPRIPTPNDIVLISHIVLYDTSIGDVTTIGIHTGGNLRFATDQITKLRVGTLLVMPGGTLEIGTEANPIAEHANAEIIIKNHPLDVTDDGVGVFDPFQFGTGILAIDGTIKMHGAAKILTFVRMSAEPQAGDNMLVLDEAVAGWNAGDRLIIPDTRHLGWREDGEFYLPQWEELILDSVSSDGKTLTLTSPLQFDHKGARDVSGQLRFLPHVGNLSRNIIIRSETSQGTRGHTLFTIRADVDVRFVLFKDLGRTTIDHLDSTTADANGNITNIGTNQIARYPFHMHHLYGPASPPSNGHQFTLIGNAIDGGNDTHGFRWGLTVHGSHYGLIKQNVVYNMAGSGIAVEDGCESFNLLDSNFVVRVFGLGGRADKEPRGSQGTGIWSRSVNSSFRNNVVANVSPRLDTFGYVIFNSYTGNKFIPAFQGADPHIDGKHTDMNALPLREFLNNEAYGAMDGGMVVWNINAHGEIEVRGGGQTVIKDVKIWHIYRRGFWNYAMSNIVVDGLTVIGDSEKLGDGFGIFMADYLADRTIFRNADIEGMRWGIYVPIRFAQGSPLFTIENSFFGNGSNIYIPSLWWCCSNDNHPRDVMIRNVKFQRLKPDGYNIYMAWFPEDPGNASKPGDLIEKSRVFVEDYQGNQNEDFQVYFRAQAPGHVVIPASEQYTGPTQAGLTNQESFLLYGLANSGEISPCTDDTIYPEIEGYVCQTNANPGNIDTFPPQVPTGLRVTNLVGNLAD